jgi:two-component system NtrC family sensor kinase
MRLWVRLTLWMALLAVAPALLTGGLAIRATSLNVRLRPEEALVRQSSSLATLVSGWVDSQARALQGWSRVWDLDRIQPELQVGLLRAVYRAIDPVVSVALIDEQGVPLIPVEFLDALTVTPGRIAGTPARAAALVDQAADLDPAEPVAISAPYLPPGAHDRVVVIAVRAGAQTRIAAELSLEALAPLFPHRGPLQIVLLAATMEPLVGVLHPQLEATVASAVSAVDGDLTFDLPALQGDSTLRGASAQVPGLGWRVVVLEPAEVGEEAIRVIRTQTAVVGLVVLVVVVALGSLLQGMITRPLTQLRDVATRIAEGDYGQRTAIHREDELGELARAFDHMAEKLQAHRREILANKEEIDAFNRELQLRVRARTAELEAAQVQLVRASEVAAVAQIGAGLAHELNNPLAAILGLTQVLRARGGASDATLARVEEQALRCREVVDTMVRLSTGEVDPRRARVVDVATIAREITDSMVTSYRQRGVSLACRTPETSVEARVDPALAERMLRGFLEALRAGMREGGALVVQVATTPAGALLLLQPDRPIDSGDSVDDWRAAGVQLWAARRLAELSGGTVTPPEPDSPDWRILLPGA